jgi:hypothetical protein
MSITYEELKQIKDEIKDDVLKEIRSEQSRAEEYQESEEPQKKAVEEPAEEEPETYHVATARIYVDLPETSTHEAYNKDIKDKTKRVCLDRSFITGQHWRVRSMKTTAKEFCSAVLERGINYKDVENEGARRYVRAKDVVAAYLIPVREMTAEEVESLRESDATRRVEENIKVEKAFDNYCGGF